jgi:hypothetical protein
MKLILVIFLIYIIVGIYSQTDEAANNDIQADSNTNSTVNKEVNKQEANKTNSSKTPRNYSNT